MRVTIENRGDFIKVLKIINPLKLNQRYVQIVQRDMKTNFLFAYLILYISGSDLLSIFTGCTVNLSNVNDDIEDKALDLFFRLLKNYVTASTSMRGAVLRLDLNRELKLSVGN